MIAILEGKLAHKGADRVVVSAGGVGYEAMVPSGTLSKLPSVGKTVTLFTRLQVRDDALALYGFATPDERDLFDMLVKVSGVGPKFALAILSVLNPDALRRAVAAGDADALTVVPGIGKKVAGRLLLDLKDKLGADVDVPVGPMSEVREALLSLGLTAQEAREAMSGLSEGNGRADRPVEELLREALKAVGR